MEIMTRKITAIQSYKIKTALGVYMVTLEQIAVSKNGNPRYKAYIVCCHTEDIVFDCYYTLVYTFIGKWGSDYDNAIKIVNEHERRSTSNEHK